MTNGEMFLRQSGSECLAACPQTFRGPHELKVSGVIALVMDTFQMASDTRLQILQTSGMMNLMIICDKL